MFLLSKICFSLVTVLYFDVFLGISYITEYVFYKSLVYNVAFILLMILREISLVKEIVKKGKFVLILLNFKMVHYSNAIADTKNNLISILRTFITLILLICSVSVLVQFSVLIFLSQ